MTLHLEGIHICHILKQWLRGSYRYSFSAKNWDENIGPNGLSRRNLHDRSRHPCCLGPIVEIRGGWPLLMCNLLFWYPCFLTWILWLSSPSEQYRNLCYIFQIWFRCVELFFARCINQRTLFLIFTFYVLTPHILKPISRFIPYKETNQAISTLSKWKYSIPPTKSKWAP